MPPRRSRKAVPAPPPKRAITAAAAILQAPGIERNLKPQRVGAGATSWQAEAWGMYDLIGEVRFSASWLGQSVSKCRLVATRIVNPGDAPDPQEDGPAAQLVADFAGGAAGQSQILERAATQLSISGELYLVGRTDPETGLATWCSASTEEVTHGNDGWQVNDGVTVYHLSDEDVLIRCWRPHPRKYGEADSPIRSSMGVLRELHALTLRVQAEVDSRLAGAGLLILPSEMTFPHAQGAMDGDAVNGGDDFVSQLIDSMITPIKDRESAAAVVPLVITAPGEFIGQAQHITFWSDLDGKSTELRNEAIRRFASAADMPLEIITGTGDVNHWGAAQVSQSAVELHVEPLAAVVCNALTLGWLRPALAAMNVADPESYSVWYDSSDLTVKADRSGDAKDLYDRGIVGADTLRRETGFTEADAPTDDELRRYILLSLVDRAADPSAILDALTSGSNVVRVSSSRTPLGTTPAPDPTTPATDPAVVAAAESATYRALELSGKRLLTRDRRSQFQNTPSHLLHTQIAVNSSDLDRLLEGAWLTLKRVHDDDRVVACVDDYVRDLLRTGTEHERGYLVAALKRAGLHG